MTPPLTTASPRLAGLDLLRSLAILFVICGHFFMHTHFNTTIFSGVSMFIQSIGKFFFGMGVPLFIILTGYLNTQKVVSAKYYKGCIRVLFSYVLISAITLLFRKYYLNEAFSWKNGGIYLVFRQLCMLGISRCG